ncbi:hypothetical protein O9K51_02463 [Purpureocillium lavendulum]|uniref:Uncharacterized protein n=1 Tax=Purpureocillium lavendulum TaxID=1247861 RepID=A0AB34FXM8_9HYPO|nr:hypothetical protein O9K51_02463 [Purpureocillium lavendulum]
MRKCESKLCRLVAATDSNGLEMRRLCDLEDGARSRVVRRTSRQEATAAATRQRRKGDTGCDGSDAGGRERRAWDASPAAHSVGCDAMRSARGVRCGVGGSKAGPAGEKVQVAQSGRSGRELRLLLMVRGNGARDEGRRRQRKATQAWWSWWQ